MAEKIVMKNGQLQVSDRPIIPFIEGDGVGHDIWKNAQAIFDKAVEVAYEGKRHIEWQELLAGKKAYDKTGEWLPKETLEAIRESLVAIKGPLETPVGGGIRSVEDMNKMLKAGADKVAVNSSALANPQLIADCAQKFGNQCVVAAIDAKKMADGSWHVFVAGGRKDTGRDLIQWAQEVVALGAGEILLTSMDKDGTKSGFDLEMLNRVAEVVDVPIIASGGAGNIEDIVEVFEKTTATGALAASIFHFGEVNIGETKQVLTNTGIEVRQ